MKKVYTLAYAGNAAQNNIESLPPLQDGDELERYCVTDTKLSWFTTANDEEHDKEKNVQNWATLLDMLDLKKESDIHDVLFISGCANPMMTSLLESRRLFLEQIAQEEGVGPKRLKMLTDALKIWFPVIAKCDPGEEFFDTWKGITRTNTTNKAKYIFIRWACL